MSRLLALLTMLFMALVDWIRNRRRGPTPEPALEDAETDETGRVLAKSTQ